MTTKSPFVAAVGLGLCIPLLTSCGDQLGPSEQHVAAAPTAGCAEAVEPIEENPDFVPYEDRLSHNPFDQQRWSIAPLSERGVLPSQLDTAPPTLDDLPAVAADITANDYYTLAYGERAPEGTQSEFLKSGGLVLEISPGEKGGGSSIARDLYNDSNGDDRIVLVPVGEFEAAVSWADPDENGVREHHVLWTDELGHDVNLYGVRSAEDLVAIARGVACQ